MKIYHSVKLLFRLVWLNFLQSRYAKLLDCKLFSNLTIQKSFGGDNEIRTHDPLLARQVLSQLSYTPTISSVGQSADRFKSAGLAIGFLLF